MFIPANIFQPLITVFETVLKFFHNHLLVSWGLAIVLLTVAIRALLLPLAVKQFHSMQKLQRLTPEMKRVQAKYKDDKQRQQQELMKLYQEHGVNPFASCLPLVAQLPVFIGLYYMLRTSLRADICPAIQRAHQHIGPNVPISHSNTVACGPHGGASFLFINDLTNKAAGATLIVLIVLYIGTMLGSQLLSATPQMDRNQRLMMMLLPCVFVFIIIGLPAGVLVYWITTNVWTIGQQYVIRRRLGPMTPLTAGGDADGKAPPGGGGGGSPGPGDGAGPNGAGSGGIAGLLRGRKAEEAEPVGAGARTRTTAPPPPPRKKKKRSGRRR